MNYSFQKGRVNEIENIKTNLEEIKQLATKSETEYNLLLEQMKNKFEINSEEEAEELYEVLTEEKEQMEIEKEKKLSLLKENLRKENLL